MYRKSFFMFVASVLFHFVLFVRSQSWNHDDNLCTTPDQETGLCIRIYSCQYMLDALRRVPKPVSAETHDYLQLYRCGFDGRTPKVCCPDAPIYLKDDGPGALRHRNVDLLPRNCGDLDTDDKIINGEKAGIFEFPWMALLSYTTRRGPQFRCGGTVINERYILTAAHCLANLQNPLHSVRVGEYDIEAIVDCEHSWEGETCAPPFHDLGIEKTLVHPSYDPGSYTNDIGLIRVSRIHFSENIQPVCLPLDDNRNYNFTNKNAFVTGWGITEKGASSNVLRKVALPVVPLDQCEEQYKNVAKIDDRQLCAGGRIGKDSCRGDSGGPLHVIGSFRGDLKLIQQGIISFGPSNCGRVPIPSVYTKVAAFMTWILDNIEP